MKEELLLSLSKKELVKIIMLQVERIDELTDRLAAIQSQLELSQKQISDLQRASKRQAAPFRIEDKKRKKEKKNPGNKPGHKGYFRKFTGTIDETIEVPLVKCPICAHTKFKDVKPVEQVVEEVVPKVVATKLITYEGACGCCQNIVSSQHPLKISHAQGAAGTYLGPKTKSMALELNFKYGLSKRKTVAVMDRLFGIKISPGGLTHMSHKVAKILEPNYEELKQSVRNSQVIHADETSWYVCDPKYWLWVFTNKGLTLYHVIRSRARAVIVDILGNNYPGVLVSDCLSIYDDVNKNQQKCYAHHLKAIAIAEELVENSPKDNTRLKAIKKMLKTAIVIKKVKTEVTNSQYRAAIEYLQKQADDLIPSIEQIEQLVEDQYHPIEFQDSTVKILKRLSKQKDHLFTFMQYDQVEATNNLAERQLRPAVISRKISCGNKTNHGANTWQIISSLIQTFIQQGKSFEQILTNSYYNALAER